MEIRCGGCKKLFRIPDEKITGKGIKFTCTRCGETVKVTKEEFEHYTLSKSAVAALDLFEEKPKPAPVSESIAEKTVSQEQAHDTKIEESAELSTPLIKSESQPQPTEEHPQVTEPTTVPEHREFEQTQPPASDIPHEEQTLWDTIPVSSATQETPEPASEPVVSAEPSPYGSTSEQVQSTESSIAELKSESVPIQEPPVAIKEEPGPEKEQISLPESLPPRSEQKAEVEQIPMAEPAASLKPEIAVPSTKSRPEKEQIPEPSQPAQTKEAPHTPLAARMATRREPATRATAASTAIRSVPIAPEAPSRSVNMFLVYGAMLIIIGLVGYGVFTYIGPKTQKSDELLRELSSTEGLRITSASGSADTNGDLLITCVIENSLDKERPAWYVVVDIFNTQGSVVGRIRSVNGKQLYTQRDYDILSKRGMNTPEMKKKNLQDQGSAIPPKSSVTFSLRYVQPADGVSNFDATIHPFDPVRMFKELAEEIQQ